MATQIKGTSTRNLLPMTQPVAPLQLFPFSQLVHRLLNHPRLGRLLHADDFDGWNLAKVILNDVTDHLSERLLVLSPYAGVSHHNHHSFGLVWSPFKFPLQFRDRLQCVLCECWRVKRRSGELWMR